MIHMFYHISGEAEPSMNNWDVIILSIWYFARPKSAIKKKIVELYVTIKDAIQPSYANCFWSNSICGNGFRGYSCSGKSMYSYTFMHQSSFGSLGTITRKTIIDSLSLFLFIQNLILFKLLKKPHSPDSLWLIITVATVAFMYPDKDWRSQLLLVSEKESWAYQPEE